jgi:hypothetical protein
MEPRNFIKCLAGGVALGGVTSLVFSDIRCNKTYYNGLYEEDDDVNYSRRLDSRNNTDVELKRPETSHLCTYDQIRHYFE